MFTTPYHPECNGQVENFHKTLKNGLACELNSQSKTWDQHMEYMLQAYQAEPHSVRGYSSYFLVHGSDMHRLDDEELSTYLKGDGEPAEMKEVCK